MNNDVIEDNEDDIYLSDHSRSMRRARVHCQNLFHRLAQETNRIKLLSIFRKGYPGVDGLRIAAMKHKSRRTNAQRRFWAGRSSPIEIETLPVKTVHGDDATEKISPDQVRCFKDRFQNLNIPCLITGLDKSQNFHHVNQQWRNHADNPVEGSSKICREWFRKELGEESLVPLRFVPLSDQGNVPNDAQSALDKDGRAMECETKEVRVMEWIQMLESSNEQTFGNGKHRVDEGAPNKIVYYLKDWHLQQRYTTNDSDGNRDSGCSLYSAPEFFGHDLLNAFLTRFTDGDYRFCYWGPSRSFTARHSDAMHSFSWSYNVVGTKEWTFYRSNPPSSTDSHDKTIDECENTFTVIQQTGQTIFVPATWQHKVVNLEETISINHNWVTSANIDLVWDCLKVEMVAIRNELQGWADGGLDQNMEACENMLRGCIGLDVTAFVLMTLVGLLEAATALVSMPLQEQCGTTNKSCQTEEVEEGAIFSTKQEELMFDCIRLASIVRDVSTTEEQLVRLRNRLSAVLQSEEMAQRIENMLEDVIDWITIG